MKADNNFTVCHCHGHNYIIKHYLIFLGIRNLSILSTGSNQTNFSYTNAYPCYLMSYGSSESYLLLTAGLTPLI